MNQPRVKLIEQRRLQAGPYSPSGSGRAAIIARNQAGRSSSHSRKPASSVNWCAPSALPSFDWWGSFENVATRDSMVLQMPELSDELREKGQAAEAAFRQWVEKSGISHLYVEQSPFSVPENLRGKIKRPDFILGFPTIGAVAFDVKAKRIYNNVLIFDDYERFALANFERLFHMSVWHACFTDDRCRICNLFVNEMLVSMPTVVRASKNCCEIHVSKIVSLDVRTRDFAKSFLEAITLT